MVVLKFACRGGYYPPAKSTQNNREAKRLPYGHSFLFVGEDIILPSFIKISLRFARDAKDVVPYNVWLFSSFHICYAKIPPSRVVFSFLFKEHRLAGGDCVFLFVKAEEHLG